MERREVPFFDYPALAAPWEEEILGVIRDVLRRGAYVLQRDLEKFEEHAREFLGVEHFIGVSDGTNALVLSLRAAGIGPGDEVIVPSHTYVASVNAIHAAGARAVLVECGPDHLMDPKSARAAITERTRALMPVHLNGRTCAMEPILALAREHDLRIVEDAAQAFGSRWRGRAAGSFGSAGTISFYPAKVLGCLGDGGGVLTNDADMARRIRLLRDHGRDASGEFVAWGTNSRLDNLQAAVLDFKLRRFALDIERRRQIASVYDERLRDLEDLALPPPPVEEGDHFDIFQNYELEAGRRDDLMAFLAERGIRAVVQWGGKPVHQIEALGLSTRLPRTDALFRRCFLLPLHCALSDEDVEYVAAAIREFYGAR